MEEGHTLESSKSPGRSGIAYPSGNADAREVINTCNSGVGNRIMSHLGGSLRRLTRPVALVALVLASAIGISIASDNASAWSWSSHVKVAGKISCANRGVVGTPSVSISLRNGESGSASVNWLNNYGIQFRQIPTSGVSGTATVRCPTWTGWRTFSTSVWVFRPALGDQISINFSG
jgi:hypothetical protein